MKKYHIYNRETHEVFCSKREGLVCFPRVNGEGYLGNIFPHVHDVFKPDICKHCLRKHEEVRRQEVESRKKEAYRNYGGKGNG